MSESNQALWTYTPTDHERLYLLDAMGEFFDSELLTDILYKVRAGKEATCYCCRARPESGHPLVAAKVYRPGVFRAMRNDWYYRIGRTMSTGGRGVAYRGRVQRALKKHTDFGKSVERVSWSGNEYSLLQRLHDQGADVPQPLAASENCILMEYLGDDSQAAPTLHMVTLDPADAREQFDRVIRNITVMLRQYVVHADLSAHNILYWNGVSRIIDLPQAVAADKHPGAFELLARDVDHVCRYFQKQGVRCDPTPIAIDLWQRMQSGEL